MAIQESVLSTEMADRKLAVAKNYIKAKNYTQAKKILNDLDHPTAHRWLLKIEAMLMFEENKAAAATQNRAATQSNLLAEVTSVFLINDWTINAQLGNTVIVEKKRAPNSLAAAAVLVIFGLIGVFIVLLAIANAKIERITLTQAEDGSVRMTGSKVAGAAVRSPHEAMRMAQSVKKGASYAATLALGIGGTIVWLLVF